MGKGELLTYRTQVSLQHSRRTPEFRLQSEMEDVKASPDGEIFSNAVSCHMDSLVASGTLFWTEGMWRRGLRNRLRQAQDREHKRFGYEMHIP